MLVSSLSFSIMQVFVKLSSEEVGTFEQTFFRNLVSLIIAAVMVRRENLQVFQEIKRGGWALWGRSFFGFLGIVLFFYAAGHARQADVAMLNRASPVFVTLLAGIFLKEKITPVKIASTILCLVGAYIASRPSTPTRSRFWRLCWQRWYPAWLTPCCPTVKISRTHLRSFSTFPH